MDVKYLFKDKHSSWTVDQACMMNKLGLLLYFPHQRGQSLQFVYFHYVVIREEFCLLEEKKNNKMLFEWGWTNGLKNIDLR